MMEAPKTLTYASVVSRETVQIALTIVALNDLEVKIVDVQNAFLTAPCSELIHMTLGPEFGEDQGKTVVIVQALYGLTSAGASFRNHLADCMHHLGYHSCLADPDFWYKPMVCPEDNLKYYSYVLLYVDDCLCICHNAEQELHKIDKFFIMKDGSIGDPDIYLGANVKQMEPPNGVKAWALSSNKYIQEAMQNCEKYLAHSMNGRKLTQKALNPFPGDYDPDLDMMDMLKDDQATYFQSQIGILQWMVELGRVVIATEVSLLSLHVALPREGHLEIIFHLYAYLKQKHNSRLALDPTYPHFDMISFHKADWTDFYGNVSEAIPNNAPEPRGKEIELCMFVDSDHANDKIQRTSRTGFCIFINMACVMWQTKHQATVHMELISQST